MIPDRKLLCKEQYHLFLNLWNTRLIGFDINDKERFMLYLCAGSEECSSRFKSATGMGRNLRYLL